MMVSDSYYKCPMCIIEDRPHDRGWCLDCDKLLGVAIEALSTARRVGVPKYGPSSWKEIPQEEHLDHARIHIQIAVNKDYFDIKDDTPGNTTVGEDHLAHAICRLAMARARANENTSSS